jgi:hypothetical protein
MAHPVATRGFFFEGTQLGKSGIFCCENNAAGRHSKLHNSGVARGLGTLLIGAICLPQLGQRGQPLE